MDASGTIHWRAERIFLTKVLAAEYVGVEETGDGEWAISFGPLRLGYYRTAAAAFVEALAWSPPLDSTTLSRTALA